MKILEHLSKSACFSDLFFYLVGMRNLDQLSPELPLQLFPDQLSLLSPESPLQLSPDMLLQLFPDLSFLATPALEDLEVFGKRHSLRTVTKTSKQKLNSNSIKFEICYVV